MVREVRFGWDDGMPVPNLWANEPEERDWDELDPLQRSKSRGPSRSPGRIQSRKHSGERKADNNNSNPKLT